MDPLSTAERSELNALRLENANLKAAIAKYSPWPSAEFVDLLPVGLAFVNLQDIIEVANPTFLDLVGIPQLDDNSPINIRQALEYLGIGDCLDKAKKTRAPQIEKKVIHDRVVFKAVIPYMGHAGQQLGYCIQLRDLSLAEDQRRKLAEQEDLVAGLARVTPSLIYLKELNSQEYTYANWDLEALGEANFPGALLHPEDKSSYDDFMANWANETSDEMQLHEFRYKRPDGNYRWMRNRCRPYKRDENGKVVQIVGVGTDVTSDKENWEQLLEQKQFIDGITATAPNFIYINTLDGQINLYCNREITELLGYTTEEYRGMNLGGMELIHPDDRALMEEDYERMRVDTDNLRYELTYRILHKNGTYIWLQRYNAPYRRNEKGEVIEIIGSAWDVTERIESEQRFRDLAALQSTTQARFQSIFEQSTEFLILMDGDFNLLEINRTFPHITREQMLGQGWKMLFADFIEITERLGRLTFDDGEIRTFEADPTNPDGSKTYLHNTISIVELDGQRSLLLKSADITLLKKAELDLRKHTVLLEASNTELEQFAYVASHDLLEPVRIVGQYLSLIEKKLKPQPGEDLALYMDFAQGANARMDSLIKGLLEFSRINNQELNLQEIALPEIFEQVNRFVSQKVAETQASLSIEVSHVVKVDPILVANLFMNLVTNALKFTAPDTLPDVRITSHDGEDGHVEIHVKDHGIGIAEKMQNRIFLVFQRLHPHSAYTGHGIGLTSAKRITERHGGTIRVVSEEGKGSTFIVTLPGA